MMMELPDIFAEDLRNRKVLIRADLNVPMENGRIADMTRIERFAPTVSALLKKGASVVVMSHLGRPEGQPNPVYSTRPLAPALGNLIGTEVMFSPVCVGGEAEKITGNLSAGEVVLLENLRFNSGETGNSTTFAISLSVHGDVYVNDAFSCAHRAHASTQAITEFLPSFAGPSLLAEVSALENALESPERPVAALVGGAKVSSKIEVLRHLITKTDYLIIGGGMANTFLAALDCEMGNSLVEKDAVPIALEILGEAEVNGCSIVLPSDLVVATEFAAGAPNRIADRRHVPADQMALDVGPQTTSHVIETLGRCKTLLWNGPMGAFEIEPFGTATFAIAQAAAKLTQEGKLITVAGGGDTVAALNAAGVADQFTYISTAGGAFLEWLEGKELPGIKALIEIERNKETA